MNELLEIGRGEYEAARWFFDEASSQLAQATNEVAVPAYERFIELRSGIMQNQADIRMRFLFIGMALLEIKRDQLYHHVRPKNTMRSEGYSSFKTFCAEVFGLKETTAKNLVMVAQEFCGEDGGLKLPYLNFSYSQLVEMLPMEEKNRLRIPPKISAKKIRALKEYYKDHVPGLTVEADLDAYAQERKVERDKKNEKRNALVFIPAKTEKQNSQPADCLSDQDEVKDFEGEDERDVITPNVAKPSFEAIREGLYMQLNLLRNCDVGVAWKKTADLFEDVLRRNVSHGLVSRHDFVQKDIENVDLRARNKTLESQIVNGPIAGKTASGKLSLKNKKEREEWLKNYESWGVWLSVPEVSKTFYRYDFENGCSVIVEKAVQYYSYSEVARSAYVRYSIIDKKHPEYDSMGSGGASGVVEWLSKHSKEI